MSSHTYQSSSAQSSTQSSSGSSDAMGLQENLGNQALLSMMSGTDLDYMEDAGNQEVLAMMGLSGSYTVQSGDSLSSIASRYDGTWQDLYDANRSQISDPNKISVGMTLTLPSGWTGGSSTPSSSHTVQSGDSLSSIADGYGQGWWDLYDANRSQISDPNKISVGMVLTIPSAWLSVTPTPEPEPEVLAPSSYTIRSGDTLSKIAALYGKDWSELYDANRSQISDPNKISVGMVLTIPSGWIGGTETETGTETGTGTDSGTVGGGNPDLVDSGPYSSVYAPDSSDTSLIVDRGQLTFDAEGTEGGTYHTRTAHWPGGNSGVTIGRGYDMGYRDYDEVYATLVGAGVSASDASALAQGAGLQGTSAQDFISSRSLPEISMKAQKTLFDEVYAVYIGYVVEISDRSDVVAKYGQVNWETLSPWILDLVVDMRYRGDYTVDTREVVQPYMVSNDVSGLSGVMNDRSLWLSVPEDRYNRRAAWMQEAELAQEQKPFDSEGDLLIDVGTADPNGVLSDSRLNPEVRAMAAETVRQLLDEGYSPYVFEGFRSFERQDELYNQGGVTQVRGGGSYHNYGLAVDIIWMDSSGQPSWSPTDSSYWARLGAIGKASGFTEWGGDWGWDMPHFELHPNNSSAYHLESTYYSSGLEGVWGSMGLATSTDAVLGATSSGNEASESNSWDLLLDGHTTLRDGSFGDLVSELQERLNAHGASLTVDGDFGARTEDAVEAFQAENSLTVDGIVGRQTASALNE